MKQKLTINVEDSLIRKGREADVNFSLLMEWALENLTSEVVFKVNGRQVERPGEKSDA